MDPKYYKNPNSEFVNNSTSAKSKNIKKQKIRLLIIIIILISILLLIVIAAIRQGGFKNLTKGDKNILQNTIENIGDGLTGGDPKPTTSIAPTPSVDYNKPLQVPQKPSNSNKEYTKSQKFNSMVLDKNGDSYNITIKPNTSVVFRNDSDEAILLEFSDKKSLSL